MIKKILPLLTLLAVTGTASAQYRADAEVIFSTDSDNTTVENYLIGGGKRGDKFDVDLLAGRFFVTDFQLNNEKRRRDFDQAKLKLAYRPTDQFQTFGWISRLQGDELSTTVGEASAVYKPNRTWRFEGGVARSIVDSINAIDVGITVDSVSASFDYNFASFWTATLATVRQSFSDENSRDIYIARLVKTSERVEGLTYQAYYRFSDADFNPVEYFAPNNQKRAMIGAGYARAFLDDRFLFRGSALYGSQWDEFVDTKALEIRLSVRGSITDQLYSTVDYIYTNDNGSIGSGVDYWYEVFYINLYYYFD